MQQRASLKVPPQYLRLITAFRDYLVSKDKAEAMKTRAEQIKATNPEIQAFEQNIQSGSAA